MPRASPACCRNRPAVCRGATSGGPDKPMLRPRYRRTGAPAMQTVSHTANTVRTGAGPGRARTSIGPAVLSVGFRPFFLLAAAWAVVAVPLWLLLFGGGAALPTAFDPVLWHGHEMLFGFVQAAVAGFLLT